MAVFLEDTPPQIGELGAALERGDVDAARQWAHTIKGAASNVGARLLSEAAAGLEERAKAGDLSSARAAFPSVESAFARLEAAVQGDALSNLGTA